MVQLIDFLSWNSNCRLTQKSEVLSGIYQKDAVTVVSE